MNVKKKCVMCEKSFEIPEWNDKLGKGKTCSRDCHIKRITALKVGKKRPDLVKNRKGELNPNWIRDFKNLKYSSIHAWIRRTYGRADHCDCCNEEKVRYEWSNKDHKYSRDLSFWQQLCVSCHKKYDFQNKLV